MDSVWFTMDADPNIESFRTMLEAIGFTISAATAISNQEGTNQFSELKAFSDDGKSMRQAKHMITAVHNTSWG